MRDFCTELLEERFDYPDRAYWIDELDGRCKDYTTVLLNENEIITRIGINIWVNKTSK